MPELGPDRIDGYLLVAAVLFVAGLFAVISRRNAIGVLIGIELLLNAAALQFAAYGRFSPNAESPQPKGEVRSTEPEVADARRAAEPGTVAARDSSRHWRPNVQDPQGQTAAVFVVVVAAAEAAVALALLFAVYRATRDIDLEQNRELRS